MKIQNGDNLIELKELNTGECFAWGGFAYIKVNSVDDYGQQVATELKTGRYATFTFPCRVMALPQAVVDLYGGVK